ncbi:MAG: Hpt domain-containing protein [Nitrospinota bacterium]|nr:Hpt domain-containing protein [Nitrospinota bacterium]
MNSKDTAPIIIKADPDLADLIPAYLENRQKDVGILKDAVSQKDFEVIKITGHSMKGSGGGYGFEGLTKIGGAIEESAKNSDLAAITSHIEELVSYLARIEVKY